MTKKNRILLISGNFPPEPTGIGKYNGEMIDWLNSKKYECGVITSYPYYPYWKIQPPYEGKSFWYRIEEKKTISGSHIKVFRCPHFVPLKPTGWKRILSDFSFFLSAFFQVFRLLFREKYDYVIVVAPPFPVGLLGLLYRKIKKAKVIYHIQDMQIDAAIELGLINSRTLIRMIFSMERFILRKVDFVSSISEGMIKTINDKFSREVILFPNWTDTDVFYPLKNKEIIYEKFNFLPSDKIILYSGAIGEKQGLKSILESAKSLHEFKELQFIICGSGPYKEQLIRETKEMNLTNVRFLPLQSIETFNELLNLASVHLVLQKRSENELFLPSKLTNILSVGGLVIVTASEQTNLYKLISENQIGIVIEPENSLALSQTIKMAAFEVYSELRQNALAYANSNLKKDNVLSEYFLKTTGSLIRDIKTSISGQTCYAEQKKN